MKRREKWTGFRGRPRGLLLFGLRLPIVLYRAKLGRLLGDRFLLLIHVGRKSGKMHRTVLEVVRRDRVRDTWYVAAGWGTTSDWYRNILRNPAVELMLGSRRARFHAEIQPEDGAAQEFLEYARRHPLAFRELAALFVGRGSESIHDTCLAMAKEIPLIAFHPLVAVGNA